MAVTLITNPNDHSSAFNPNLFLLNSALKNNAGYRYIFEIHAGSPLVPIYREIIPPRPVDGYGEIDVQRLFQDKINCTPDFTSLIGNFQMNTGNDFQYQIRLGEEYIKNNTYPDTTFDNGRVKVTPPIAHGYNVGDVVNIIPNDPTIFPQFQGVFVVWAVPTSNTVIFDITHVSTPLNPGVITYADNRKTRVMYGVDISKRFAHNTVFQHSYWRKDAITSGYLYSGSLTNLATTFKSGYKISVNSPLFFNWIFTGYNLFDLNFQKSGGAVVTKSITAPTNEGSVLIDVAPKTAISGVLLFDGITPYYDFWITVSGAIASNKIRIYIDYSCSPNDSIILFQDRLGSIQSLNFRGFSQRKIDVKKEIYNAPLSLNNSGEYEVATAKGSTVISSEQEEVIILNSYPYTREQDAVFEELISSKKTWLFNSDSDIQPVNIHTSNVVLKDFKQGGLRVRTIEVKKSNTSMVNG